MMRLKDMRNGIFRGMLLGGQTLAGCASSNDHLAIGVCAHITSLVQVCLLPNSKLWSVASLEVCDGKESAGVCQEVSIRHTGHNWC